MIKRPPTAGEQYVNQYGTLFVGTTVPSGETMLCNVETGELHICPRGMNTWTDYSKNLTKVKASFTHEPIISAGDRYTLDGTEYLVCRISNDTYCLCNITSGNRFHQPQEDINKIFGDGLRSEFLPC